jgi:hypothetical protein
LLNPLKCGGVIRFHCKNDMSTTPISGMPMKTK